MGVTPRDIPAIEALIRRDEAAPLIATYGRDAVLDALRTASSEWRHRLVAAGRDGQRDLPRVSTPAAPDPADLPRAIVAAAATTLAASLRPSLRAVLNATGVVLHTNLGRAPLAEPAIAHLSTVARGYANLEYDLERGDRGHRDTHAQALLTRLTGAEAAVVVNNNAAATLLVLASLAAGREVLISRGELVAIGGGFRVPDVLRQSGAELREVGTTNRTRVADYAAAVGPRSGMILRVHPSNFRMEGFTEQPDAAALIALARRFDLPIVEDLGSGNVLGPTLGGETMGSGTDALEPTVSASVSLGYDVVCISGDKLLGGPQAGIVLGRHQAVDRVRRHPLMRALRVDKLTYAALEATLLEHVAGRASSTVPVAAMIAATVAELDVRARAVAARVAAAADLEAEVIDGESAIGGGSAPGRTLPTRLVAVAWRRGTADQLAARLRAQPTPVIARIERDRVVLDLRTVRPDEDEELARGVVAASQARGSRLEA